MSGSQAEGRREREKVRYEGKHTILSCNLQKYVRMKSQHRGGGGWRSLSHDGGHGDACMVF